MLGGGGGGRSTTRSSGSEAQRRAAFVQLLAAYQVLRDARARQLYDASRDARGPAFLRDAAAAGVAARGPGYDDAPEVQLGWGLGALFAREDQQQQQDQASGALDHLRREVKG